jgi:hypothetical protein
MKDRKFSLLNLPTANNSIGTVEFTGDASPDIKKAAADLQVKVDKVIKHRHELAANLSDRTIFERLQKE